MATFSGGETIVNITKLSVFYNTSPSVTSYTVPAGRYAKVNIQSLIYTVASGGASPVVNFGSLAINETLMGNNGGLLSPFTNGSSSAINSVNEIILTAGETVTFTGGGVSDPVTLNAVIREFTNP